MFPFLTGTSAAQNLPVIRICSKCGALLVGDDGKCCFCEVPDELGAFHANAGANVPLTESDEPEWRREVTRRLGNYRARRNRVRPPEEPQPDLPFRPQPSARSIERTKDEPERSHARPLQRQRHLDRMEICIQPEFDFSSAPDDRAHPQTALAPVASLAERRWAGAFDALFLILSCAGFLVLFHSLGGEIAFAKTDAIVYFAALYLLYGSYFSLFTTFAGATPGMQFCNLAVVRLDGSLPDTRQLLWRSFGYLLSGVTMMMGFLWTLWDEDHFSWQDRISQTYITAAIPLDAGSSGIDTRQHTFAQNNK